MAKDPMLLRKKFTDFVMKNWIQNNHDLKDISCTYVLVAFNYTNQPDIVYIGSTMKLLSRYKSHNIPDKILKDGCFWVMYYLPLKNGFYDYEIKLIRKLKPQYNKLHYGS